MASENCIGSAEQGDPGIAEFTNVAYFTAKPSRSKNYVFAQPTLIAETEFGGWTDAGNLRHTSYKGLREVQDAAVCELDWSSGWVMKPCQIFSATALESENVKNQID